MGDTAQWSSPSIYPHLHTFSINCLVSWRKLLLPPHLINIPERDMDNEKDTHGIFIIFTNENGSTQHM